MFALIVAHFVVLLLLAGEARDDAREDAPSSADAGAAALFAPSRSWPARLDVAILVAYTIEAFLRVFALGFASGPHAYLRDNYNRLDFVVVLASWTVVTVRARNWARWPLTSGLGQFRLFRAFLALREYPVSGALVAIVEALSRSVDVLIDLSGVTALCAALRPHGRRPVRGEPPKAMRVDRLRGDGGVVFLRPRRAPDLACVCVCV